MLSRNIGFFERWARQYSTAVVDGAAGQNGPSIIGFTNASGGGGRSGSKPRWELATIAPN
jgi:hypothetical protein